MRNKMCRALSIAVSVALTSTLMLSAKPYEAEAEEKEKGTNLSLKEQLLKNDNSTMNKNDLLPKNSKLKINNQCSVKGKQENPNETVRVIVELTADSAAEETGNAAKVTRSELNNVIKKQSDVKKNIESVTGAKVKNTYANVLNGFSISVKRKDIETIKKIKGVKNVSEVKRYKPEMTTAKELTQIKNVWKNLNYKGEGLVAAIIDTGIDYTHKDFKAPSDKTKLKINKKNYDVGKYFTDKIPYGYNFADKNNDIIDTSGNHKMHGMHVAGIVGADGSEEEVTKGEAIQGVAPEAQLLAMKVFSNNSNDKYCYSDDVVAAIEKSVEVGADVINMSIGSPFGFVDSNDPEQKAIKEAVDAGVVCVLSAGNDYNSTHPYVLFNQKDTGVVSSAGVAPEAIQVASCMNINSTESSNTGAKMSSYTSWGPAPNLDFAPEVTAPGENINSTANKNEYQYLSGTSMASPHTAGTAALILQSVKEKKLGLSGKDLVNYIKNSLINTSKILYDKEDSSDNLPYSPRRQGAGLIQAEDAVKNNVLASGKDGQATVSLKEIGQKTTFDITLKNYGDKAETYEVQNPGGVLTSYVPEIMLYGMNHDINLKGAEVKFDKNEVTVPAKGTSKVTVSLNIDNTAEKGNYAEGYIIFKNKKNDPSLNVPFMGYYGNWSEEKNISPMVWDKQSISYLIHSCAAVRVSGKDDTAAGYEGTDEYGNIKVNPDNIAISPNGDGNYDELIPSLYMLRNAKSMSVDILNKDRRVIAQNVKKSANVSRDTIAGIMYGTDSADAGNQLEWNGKTYNNKTGKDEVVPDGQYYMNIKSKIDMQNTEEQTVEIPVKVDTEAPEVKLLSEKHSDSDKYDLKFTVDDKISGVKECLVNVNGNKVEASTKDNRNYECTVSLQDDKKDNTIEIVADDNAMNIENKTFEVSTLKDTAPVMFDNFEPNTNYSKKNITVTGRVSSAAKTLKIAGNDVQIKDDRTFETEVTLNEGVNAVSVYAADKDGSELVNYGVKVFCDVTAPLISLNSPSEDNGKISVPSHKVELKGKVSDNFSGYEFYINGEEVIKYENDGKFGPEANMREFAKNLTVNDGDIISLKAVDPFGNSTIKKYTVNINPSLGVSIKNAADGGYYNKDVIPEINYNEDLYDVSMTVNGQAYRNGQALTAEGSYTLVVKSVIKGEDKPKGIQKYHFTIDKTAPKVKIINVENGKVYNKIILPKVEVEDGAVVTSITLDGKEYDKADITKEGKHKIMVRALDKAGNDTIVQKEFTIDMTAPEVTVSGVFDGSEYNDMVTPVVRVNEETSKLTVTLDGKEYDGSVISTDGKHVLIVTAVDLAGNISEKTVTFTVKLIKAADQNLSGNPGGSNNKTGSANVVSSIKDNNTGGNKPDSPAKISQNDNMPKTGSAANTISIVLLSMLLIVLGSSIIISRKEKNNQL